jgi:hypothetical protein
MLVSLVAMPYLFIIGDYLLSSLMLFLNGGQSTPFTDSEINGLKNGLLSDFYKLTTVNNCDINITFGAGGTMQFDAFVDELRARIELLTAFIDQDSNFSAIQFSGYINDIQANLNIIYSFSFTGLGNDYSTLSDIVNSLHNNMYLSSDNAVAIGNIQTDLSSFQTAFLNINDDLQQISSSA